MDHVPRFRALLDLSQSRREFGRFLVGMLAFLGLTGGVFAAADVRERRRKRRRIRRRRRRDRDNPGGGGDPGGDDDDPNVELDAAEQEFLARLNAFRVAHGQEPLTHNAQLTAAASAHALDMATRNYFTLESPEGVGSAERIIDHGYDAAVSAENLARGIDSAQQLLNAWAASSAHRVNMLSANFTETGIGRAYRDEPQPGWYWSNTFGRPA